MVTRLDPPTPMNVAFSSHIGVEVKGDTWSAIEIPNSTALFGGLGPVRVDAQVDEMVISDMGLMPTGSGQLMLSVSAALRKKLGKEVGVEVHVVLLRRLT